MKKLSFLALAAAGLLMVGCADKDEVAQDVNKAWNGEGEGYMAVNINLPTQPSTRAANDDYDDGLSSEYKVKDAALLLFTSDGKDEGAAVLLNAQNIKLPWNDKDADENGLEADGSDKDALTATYVGIAKVSGELKTNLYGLVCVNYREILGIANGVATIGGTALTNGTTTFADVVTTLTTTADLCTPDYFFMTNAIFSTVKGGTEGAPDYTKLTQLVKIDTDKIYPTEEQAKQKGHEAASINVERAVAKATLSLAENLKIAKGEGTDQVVLANIVDATWAIDNKEPSTYVVRNSGYLGESAIYSANTADDKDNDYVTFSSEYFTTPNYRFIGTAVQGKTKLQGDQEIFRSYWCVDPQYNKAATGMIAATTFGATGLNKPQYCHENTFDVDRQSYKNTTRAIIRIVTDKTDDFYTVNGADEMLTQTAAESYAVTAVTNNPTLQNLLKGELNENQSYNFTEGTFTLTYELDATTAQYKVKTIALSEATQALIGTGKTFKASLTTTWADATAIINKAIEDANADVVILKYGEKEDGKVVMYYEARFEHFAATQYEKGKTADTYVHNDANLAPWNVWESKLTGVKPLPAAGSPDDATAVAAYPGIDRTNAAGYTKTSSENYLGRWGMVRNNWYDVTVTGISKIGSPVNPAGKISSDGTPDDTPEQYISLKINVLSWAKRTQSWSF